MVASQLLFSLIMCICASKVHPQPLYGRLHVSEEGRPVTLPCVLHDEPYTYRQWRWQDWTHANGVIYMQDSGGPVNATGARPDMSVDPTDFSLTIGSLQLKDTGNFWCLVYRGGIPNRFAFTSMIVYSRLVEARYNTSLTLQCPVAVAAFSTRQWYHGILLSIPIYTQNTSGVTQGRGPRGDMSLDPDTFELIIGNVRLEDYAFICNVKPEQNTNLGIIFIAIYNVEFETEENTSVTLPCDKAQELTRQSTGHYTRTWQRVNGDILYLQYLYNGTFYEHHPAARADMSLNNETFALTIRHAQRDDTTMFICTLKGTNQWFSHLESVKLTINKKPLSSNIHPNVGPLSGGTKLTLTGSYLSSSGLIIKLADIECPMIFKNTTVVVCITPRGGADVLNTPLSITITWGGGAHVQDTMQTFTYRPDPTITKLEPTESILSGGTGVTVTGDGLDVVGEPILQVTVLYEALPVHVFQSICQIVSFTTMYCAVPKIDILGPDGNLDLSALTTPSPRIRRHVKALRHRRQADGNGTASVIINNDEIDFRLGVFLDGVPTYRNLSETLPQYAQLTVYVDPEVYHWTELKVVTSANRKLQVKGRGLLVGIESTDYRMLIGQSECSTLDVYTNILICTAPKDPPAPHHTDTARGLLSVRVHIGVFKEPFLVGTLQYKLSFFDDPLTKWGIIGAAVVIGIILVMITIICVKKKCRKVK